VLREAVPGYGFGVDRLDASEIWVPERVAASGRNVVRLNRCGHEKARERRNPGEPFPFVNTDDDSRRTPVPGDDARLAPPCVIHEGRKPHIRVT
jgi:hypothetical protein